MIESGVVEWHVWNALVEDVEHPDRVVFDIDPGEHVTWEDIVAAARRLRIMLRAYSLESWVKTTGGKGVHVVVPFRPEHDWDRVFDFSHHIATQMSDEEPDRYITSFDRAERGGKILIDYKRNYRTSIAVAAYSTRARPNAPIGVPVRWEELARLRAPDFVTVANVRERIRKLAEDPWAGYWIVKQRLVL
jgi:bifunctional non-homologous end joining protein LigD